MKLPFQKKKKVFTLECITQSQNVYVTFTYLLLRETKAVRFGSIYLFAWSKFVPRRALFGYIQHLTATNGTYWGIKKRSCERSQYPAGVMKSGPQLYLCMQTIVIHLSITSWDWAVVPKERAQIINIYHLLSPIFFKVIFHVRIKDSLDQSSANYSHGPNLSHCCFWI